MVKNSQKQSKKIKNVKNGQKGFKTVKKLSKTVNNSQKQSKTVKNCQKTVKTCTFCTFCTFCSFCTFCTCTLCTFCIFIHHTSSIIHHPSSITHHPSSIISHLIDCLPPEQDWISQSSLIPNYDHRQRQHFHGHSCRGLPFGDCLIRRALLLIAVILHPSQRPINLACSVILLSTVLFCTEQYYPNS